MSDRVYGIDLGTTYSAIAQINDIEMPEIINNLEGDSTTPSAIYFETADNVVVGNEAKNMALSDPDNVCVLIKRQMGTDYTIEYQGTEYNPEALSALILKELVHAANQETGEEVKKVVITVPAYFGVQEREATRQAGEIAGLEVVGIVPEPVAAALSLGLKNVQEDGSEETIMVYDLGGGTFDTTVMTVAKGKVDVVAVLGDRVLGGADWDKALMDVIVEKFAAAAGVDQYDLAADDEFLAELQLQAENAKKSLTKKQSANVLCSFDGQKQTVSITREEFEAATEHLVAKTVEVSRSTVELAESKKPGLTIDRVLLVGGSARMPMIAAALRDQLGWDPQTTDFDLAVAKGAAQYGQAAVSGVLVIDSEDEEARNTAEAQAEANAEATGDEPFKLGGEVLQVSNVLSRGLGIQFVRGDDHEKYIHFFAHMNDRLPLDVEPIRAATSVDNQQSVNLEVFEQAGEEESDVPEDNKFLKSVALPFPRPMPKGSPIEIDIKISAEGTVKLQAVDPESQNRADLEVTTSVLSADQVQQAASLVDTLTLRS